MDAPKPLADSPPPSPECERLEALLAVASDAICAVDESWRLVVINAAAESYFGLSREQVLGRNIWEIMPQARGTPYEAACRAAMNERKPTVLEARSLLREGRIVEVEIRPLPDGAISIALRDVTDRRRVDEAVRAERDRAAEILESISDAFYAVDEDWRFTYVNRVAESWWGRSREELVGKVFQEEFPEVFGTRSYEAHLTAARERRVVRLETISPVIGRWVELSVFPSERGLSVYFRDIQERKLAEERQRLLVNELNHRVKNSLAVVQGLARQTLTPSRSMEEARAAFTDRLIALSAAQDIITAEQWAGAPITELVERSVASHVEPRERLTLDGPAVSVPPNIALSLSLAFHELVTNAMKYGALSTPAGEIRLQWRLNESASGRRLCLEWRESGGPKVEPPRRKGFGSRLIERALAADLGGPVRLDYAAEGVVCDIEAELPDPELAEA